MNTTTTALRVAIVLIAACFAAPLRAAEESKILPRVLEACKAEIPEYCSKITPGSGRLIACLYAHQDELSGRCDYVLFDAAHELQNLMLSLSQIAEVCKPDIELLCAQAQAGEGRIAQCLRKNQMALSAPCATLIEKSGIEVD